MTPSRLSSGPASRRRTITRVAIGAALLLLAAHTATWFIVTGRIAEAWSAYAAAAAREGWKLESGPPARSGWPWAATIRLPDVTATPALDDAPFRWTAGHIDLTIAPADPNTLRIEPGGAQTLHAPGAEIALQARSASLRTPLDGNGPTRLAITALAATATGPELRVAEITAQAAEGAWSATATGITPWPPAPPPLASPARAAIQLQPGPPAEPVQLPVLQLDWGPLHLTGTAAGALDPDGQPTGRARVLIQGGPEFLDAAATAGLLQPAPAAAAKAVLALLSLAAAGNPVPLPATLQDRTLTVAGFPLLRLPRLTPR